MPILHKKGKMPCTQYLQVILKKQAETFFFDTAKNCEIHQLSFKKYKKYCFYFKALRQIFHSDSVPVSFSRSFMYLHVYD